MLGLRLLAPPSETTVRSIVKLGLLGASSVAFGSGVKSTALFLKSDATEFVVPRRCWAARKAPTVVLVVETLDSMLPARDRERTLRLSFSSSRPWNGPGDTIKSEDARSEKRVSNLEHKNTMRWLGGSRKGLCANRKREKGTEGKEKG